MRESAALNVSLVVLLPGAALNIFRSFGRGLIGGSGRPKI
jgi:hypothetical protein